MVFLGWDDGDVEVGDDDDAVVVLLFFVFLFSERTRLLRNVVGIILLLFVLG